MFVAFGAFTNYFGMPTFATTYDTTIRDLESKLSDLIDGGLDFDLDKRGDVLTIEFEDGEKIVITPQAPLEQLWVSANYAGHRFLWSETVAHWVNEKSGESIQSFLAKALSEKLQLDVSL